MDDELVGKLKFYEITIDKERKRLEIDNGEMWEYNEHIDIDFNELDKFIELLQKAKKMIKNG